MFTLPYIINVREYQKGQSDKDFPKKLATQGTQDKEKHNTMCVGQHYAQANTNNVNKT